MSLIKANAVQIGQSPTATQNFTLAVPSSPDGTIKLARGNAGATTQDVLSVDALGNVSFAGTTGLGNISNSTAIATGSTTARSLANRFADAVSVKDFGAVGNGIADDTAAIQAAINSASSNAIIDGFNKNYVVTTLNLKSNIIFQNFNLKTKAGSIDFVSPITIGSDTDLTVKSNITILNVNINGNRQNQTNITSPGPEDGGRSGFRIIGKVKNLLINNCIVEYCATDGIEIYTGMGAWVDDGPFFQNITVQNCQFNWNRRHGGSLDYAKNIVFENCIFNNNGTDLNTTSPLNDGNRGSRSGGLLYGNGFDVEGYGGNNPVSYIYFSKCKALDNARSGILFYDTVDPSIVGFIPNNNIYITSCVLNQGVNYIDNYALQLTSSILNASLGYVYKNVFLTDNTFLSKVLLRSVNGTTIDGGIITDDGSYIGILDYAINVKVGEVLINKSFDKSNSTVTYAFQPTGNLVQGYTQTIPAGATIYIGYVRALTYGNLMISSDGATPGQDYSVNAWLRAGSGVVIQSIYNGSLVGTTSGNTLQIITTDYEWGLKNNAATPMRVAYYFLPL